MSAELHAQFLAKFGLTGETAQCFFAPGRVNLIGDHTDYTGGKVFPCAIDSGTTLLIRPSKDGQFRFASNNLNVELTLDSNAVQPQTADQQWCNYPLGVIDQFRQRGIDAPSIECLYSGTIPNGAGLSSSASVLVATAFALNTLTKSELSNIELVKLSQRAEWEYANTQCGILDQFAVAMGRQNQAIELDCQSLNYCYVPLSLPLRSLVVTNTHQERRVSESAYNVRVAECRLALKLLQNTCDVSYLGEVSTEMLETHRGVFKHEPLAYARARHVVSENRRVSDAVDALETHNIARFGQLMNESHTSLANDYEVSTTELDALVSAARAVPGVYGSRLTGAGFGGCTVSIVDDDRVDEFKSEVASRYKNETGLNATFYRVKPSAGVHEVMLT